MATGAEREPHGRAKVTYDCESETWLENSSHKQWPSESTKTKRNCATGQKGQKNNASSSQIRPWQISRGLTLPVLTYAAQINE